MTIKKLLIEKLETLLPEEQEKVAEFIAFLEFSRHIKEQQSLSNKESVSPLGNRLRATRAEIIASGEPLLTLEQADGEKAQRHGRYQGN